MWLLTLAWKNLWRNRVRSLITMSAIFFAVILAAVVTSLQQGVFDNLIKNVVSFYSGYIQVHQKGYWTEQVLENSFDVNETAKRAILGSEDISVLSPRLESFALASSADLTKGCLVAGISPTAEDSVTGLRSKLTGGAYLQDTDHAVLLAEGLAKRLKLKLADTLVLLAQGYHGTVAAGKYPVKGILHFGSPDLNDKIVFLPIKAAQQMFAAENRATSYVLSLKDPGDLKTAAVGVSARLGREYEVLTWEDMMPEIKQHIRTDTASMSIITGILYLLICFGIFGTLLMMMVERRFELGMLVAIGMKKDRLCRLLLAESILTVITGCLLGILASIPILSYLHDHPIRISGEMGDVYKRFGFEPVFPTATDPAIYIRQGMIVLLIGLLLSLYPVINILRMKPVTAMRK